MILGCRDKRTRDFAAGKRVKAFSGIERAARLKRDRLEAAMSLSDLATLPGNRFEALTGGVRDNIASVLTTNGGYVLSGRPGHQVRRTLRLLTIIRGRRWR